MAPPGKFFTALERSAAVAADATSKTRSIRLLRNELRIEASFWRVPLVLVASYVANFLPSVPAQHGVFEYARILAVVTAHVHQEPALAFGLSLHVKDCSPLVLLTPVAMILEGLTWNRLVKDQSDHVEEYNASE